jgi:hypothetical protein
LRAPRKEKMVMMKKQQPISNGLKLICRKEIIEGYIQQYNIMFTIACIPNEFKLTNRAKPHRQFFP